MKPSLAQRDVIIERLTAKFEPMYQRATAQVLQARLQEKLNEISDRPVVVQQTMPTIVEIFNVRAEEIIRQWRLESPQNANPVFAGVTVKAEVVWHECKRGTGHTFPTIELRHSEMFQQLLAGTANVRLYHPTTEEVNAEFQKANQCS